jgi:hypothetical protein
MTSFQLAVPPRLPLPPLLLLLMLMPPLLPLACLGR